MSQAYDQDIRLSAYLPTAGKSDESIQTLLKSLLGRADRMLLKEKGEGFAANFLSPIKELQMSPTRLRTDVGGWAIFRSAKSFRLKRLLQCEKPLKVISSSFHVKPLIKSLQMSPQAYLLVLQKSSVELYDVTSDSIRKINSSSFSSSDELDLGAIDLWVMETIKQSKSVIVVGSKREVQRMKALSQIPQLRRAFHLSRKTKNYRESVFQEMSRRRNKSRLRMYRKLLKDYSDDKLTGGLERVADAVAKNNVKRLYVAEDQLIWGLFDRRSGAVTLRPFQMDCRDDDILDDLAETTIDNGGEVILLPKAQMPEAWSAAAVLKHDHRAQRVCKALGFPRLQQTEVSGS